MRIFYDSFIDATGSATVNGKEYRWEFHEYLGPTFIGKRGEPLKWQPGSRHPVWTVFHQWLKDWKDTKKS